MRRSEAWAIRKSVELGSAALPDAEASLEPTLTRKLRYDGKLIKAGTRIQWGDGLKRAAVDLWDTEENNPENAPSLWEDVAYYKGYRIIPEVITATLAFSNGEIGYWPQDGKFYESKRDGNTWPPSVTPEWWNEVEVI